MQAVTRLAGAVRALFASPASPTARVRRTSTAVAEPCEDRVLFSTYTVTNTLDSGAGSLRDAITKANATTASDNIEFRIGTGLKTIQVKSQLPSLFHPAVIDGTTQGGYAGQPLIELRGDLATTADTNGLTLYGGSSTVKGLIVNRFTGNGIRALNNGGNTFKGNWIGVDAAGTAAAPNRGNGLYLQTANNTVGGTYANDRNVISGNGGAGVFVYNGGATGNKIIGNYVGTNVAGTAAIANTNGVQIWAAKYNRIGGVTAGERNILSGNRKDGVLINGSWANHNVVQGNYIGLNATGTARVANQDYGVEISQGWNTVGGNTAGARNIISGNHKSGIALWLASCEYCTVAGNYIGTDVTGTKVIANWWNGIDVTGGAKNNLIGGGTIGDRNVISANGVGGVQIDGGSGNKVINNTIGFNAARTGALGNNANGIALYYTTNTTISNNLIGNNGANAVFKNSTNTGVIYTGNTIINDSVFWQ